MDDLQCPACNSRRVTTMNDCLACLACGHREYLYDYNNAYDAPVSLPEEADPEQAELRDRVDNLEAISAQPGRTPRKFHDEVQQLRAEVQYLRGQVIKAQKPDAEGAARPRKVGVRIE